MRLTTECGDHPGVGEAARQAGQRLKRGLREWLAGVPYVERVSDAEQGDGGAGCSVIWPK